MSETNEPVVIVGNGVAGSTAAFTLREVGFSGKITLVTEEPWPVYYRTRLPEVVSKSISLEKIIMSDAAKHGEKGIDLRLSTRVSGGDSKARELVLASGEKVRYGMLLLAVGAQATVPPVPGLKVQPGVFCLRSAEDAHAMTAFSAGRKTAVCIGGGILGLEIAYHLAKLGLSVEIVEYFPRLMPRQLDVRGAAILKDALEKKGMKFILGAKAKAFSRSGDRGNLEIDGMGSVEGEVFVVSAGVAPRKELLGPLGVSIDRGITIDGDCRTSVPGIFAAGDPVQYQGKMWGTWVAARHWGIRAAKAMAGKPAPFEFPPDVFRLKLTGIDLLCLGEPDLEGKLAESGEVVATILAQDPSACVYHKIVAKQGRICGAILLGPCPKAGAIEKAVRENRDFEELKRSL